MKTTLVVLFLVGVTYAFPQGPVNTPAKPDPKSAPPKKYVNPWGNKAYGMGLNNPWARPVNPIMMRQAVNLANTLPNVLVRVDVDGEIAFTNQYGQEVEILDGFGNDMGEFLDEEHFLMMHQARLFNQGAAGPSAAGAAPAAGGGLPVPRPMVVLA